MKAYVYYDDLGKDIRVEEIPEDMQEDVYKRQTRTLTATRWLCTCPFPRKRSVRPNA